MLITRKAKKQPGWITIVMLPIAKFIPKKEPPAFYSRGTSLFVLGYQTSYNYFINCLVNTASPAFTWIR
jgi:hypothetical protein